MTRWSIVLATLAACAPSDADDVPTDDGADTDAADDTEVDTDDAGVAPEDAFELDGTWQVARTEGVWCQDLGITSLTLAGTSAATFITTIAERAVNCTLDGPGESAFTCETLTLSVASEVADGGDVVPCGLLLSLTLEGRATTRRLAIEVAHTTIPLTVEDVPECPESYTCESTVTLQAVKDDGTAD